MLMSSVPKAQGHVLLRLTFTSSLLQLWSYPGHPGWGQEQEEGPGSDITQPPAAAPRGSIRGPGSDQQDVAQ